MSIEQLLDTESPKAGQPEQVPTFTDEDLVIEELPSFDLALLQGCGDMSSTRG
jgi:hypothetical protein